MHPPIFYKSHWNLLRDEGNKWSISQNIVQNPPFWRNTRGVSIINFEEIMIHGFKRKEFLSLIILTAKIRSVCLNQLCKTLLTSINHNHILHRISIKQRIDKTTCEGVMQCNTKKLPEMQEMIVIHLSYRTNVPKTDGKNK